MRITATSNLLVALTLWVGLVTTCCGQNAAKTAAPHWQPAKTRAFIVSLTQFKDADTPSFSTDDRLDDRFVQDLEKRGVPRGQIGYLKDKRATKKNIQAEFTALLRQSQPGETLFFYFGSHGGYDAENGKCWFVSFDESVSFNWVFDAIERDFKGAHAILLADCCHSGGIVELARHRKTKIAYACLSSTFMHQTAWSGWRFMQCLMRGLEGNPVVDKDGNGSVDLQELADYTEHYMAFAAEGKPGFLTTNGFDPRMRLAQVVGQKKDAQVGALVVVQSSKHGARAEVMDVKGNQFKVHYTVDTRTAHDEWVAKSQVQPPRFEPYRVGAKVELRGASDRKWYRGVVLKTWESLQFCRYDGYGQAYDEWFGPSRIRPLFDGSWTGTWQNDVDQTGDETLVLHTKSADFLTGTWSGDVPLIAERVGKNVFLFDAKTPTRTYRGVGRIDGQRLFLDYAASGENAKYSGWVTLQQTGTVDTARRDPRAEFGGKWKGTYINSQGGEGEDTLELTENDGRLQGNWSGLAVKGERLGNAICSLRAKEGDLSYRLVGRVDRGNLNLSYSATSKAKRYTGWGTFKR